MNISLNNQDLQFAFIKLLQFGYDIPSRYTDEFKNPSMTNTLYDIDEIKDDMDNIIQIEVNYFE